MWCVVCGVWGVVCSVYAGSEGGCVWHVVYDVCGVVFGVWFVMYCV